MPRRGDSTTDEDYRTLRRFVQVILLDYVPMPRTIDAAHEVTRAVRAFMEGERCHDGGPASLPAKDDHAR